MLKMHLALRNYMWNMVNMVMFLQIVIEAHTQYIPGLDYDDTVHGPVEMAICGGFKFELGLTCGLVLWACAQ